MSGPKAIRFETTIVRDGAMSHIEVPFDPVEVFGKVRAPVKVTLNGYTFRSTIARMGGVTFIPLRKSHREAAGLDGGERLTVLLEADAEPREVKIPPDLRRSLGANPPALKLWKTLSYTHRRECVESIESAKKAETRARRVEAAVKLALSQVSK